MIDQDLLAGRQCLEKASVSFRKAELERAIKEMSDALTRLMMLKIPRHVALEMVAKAYEEAQS